VLVTDMPLSERVNLVINQEKVGEGRLCVYEGRFALEVQ
jgi:flagellar motor switch/type III secretory pathway protein FliN